MPFDKSILKNFFSNENFISVLVANHSRKADSVLVSLPYLRRFRRISQARAKVLFSQKLCSKSVQALKVVQIQPLISH